MKVKVISNNIWNKHIYKLLHKELLCCRLLPSISQFQEGLGDFWHVVMTNKDVMRPFFVSIQKLTWLQLKSLYVIEWSPQGSNKHAEEEDTIFVWEKFLQNCERELILKINY